MGFQWAFKIVSCIAIWMTGLVLNGIRQFPRFYLLSMLGVFLWATGKIVSLYDDVQGVAWKRILRVFFRSFLSNGWEF